MSGTSLEVKTKSLFGFKDVFGCKHATLDRFLIFALDSTFLKFIPFYFQNYEFGPLGKEKYLALPTIYKNTPEEFTKKNFDFKTLHFSQSLDNPRRILGFHSSCIFDLKLEETGVNGYTDIEVEQGKAIGMVLLPNMPITKLVSLNLLPNGIITVHYFDMSKELKCLI